MPQIIVNVTTINITYKYNSGITVFFCVANDSYYIFVVNTSYTHSLPSSAIHNKIVTL